MKLEQLRIFVGVAEQEHVTRAAEALNITQSAASAAIAALEGRHGVHLFDRVGRRIILTEIGRGFLDAALDVVMVLPSNEAVCTAVIEGVGVAALSALVVDPALDRALLHAAQGALTVRKFVCLRHKERSISLSAKAFERLIQTNTMTPDGRPRP
ncbi:MULTISPECIES: LysR family transcriptional regulator [unclassified Sphingomonas]|uniref:LysR family transcriptional regulator n=1 Tax=unclassified Sphingomonas TaxID=196159 RepID=UPI0006FC9B8B|nr:MULTISPECIES: LysR family transcriptional regulator [unclassified Sphingomonas]KQX25977.1 hypothetical protein ASD17_00445 [Sphingomonas sp. Root1294]KQY69042.1 hypothetical protein ASD39_01640 [Sphingomonas sp. Root50]KRB89297.1 hypothetical protein ASE22_16555 [Sphingomonas sp. Root720]